LAAVEAALAAALPHGSPAYSERSNTSSAAGFSAARAFFSPVPRA